VKEFHSLTSIQQSALIASIIGDGEITKIYKGSRRKNNSYREHYGKQQEEYRKWKQTFFPDLFYLTIRSNTLRSPSHQLFTKLFPYFYDKKGNKQIPTPLLKYCKEIHFLAMLYMDDGSLCITKRVNHLKKRIYLSPLIALYLQNYPLEQLKLLQEYISSTFGIYFSINRRKDGHGHILRFTSTSNTYRFLETLKPITSSCPSMFYKTDWTWRFNHEKNQMINDFPDYSVISSSSERFKNYSDEEINKMIFYKNKGCTDNEIAKQLKRSYWSVVYKCGELRKSGRL
jgi:hypothetical protein